MIDNYIQSINKRFKIGISTEHSYRSDSGVPEFDNRLAKKLSGLGIPCFGCTPNKLLELVEGALRGDDLTALAVRITASGKGR